MARPRPTDAEIRRRNDEKELTVFCWCRDKIVKVPAREVRLGVTHSCGRECCTSDLVALAPQIHTDQLPRREKQ